MRHKLIEKFDDYEVVLVLRNRYNSFIELNKTVSNPFEGIFKNSYIDVLLPKPTDKFKCDPNKEIFKTERYSLTSLEHELNVTNLEPSNFHGLEPYELAEFRVVRSVTLEKLDIKQKKLAQGSLSSTNLRFSAILAMLRLLMISNVVFKSRIHSI